MGYTTEFSGRIAISPSLDPKQCERINQFLDDNASCDWAVSTDGASIGWSGMEKSYDMEVWLARLIARFFKTWGRTLDGELRARGESFDDVWTLVCRKNVVSRKDGW